MWTNLKCHVFMAYGVHHCCIVNMQMTVLIFAMSAHVQITASVSATRLDQPTARKYPLHCSIIR